MDFKEQGTRMWTELIWIW